VHVVGSNNDLGPWFGAAETPEQRAARLAEYEARIAADRAWLDRAFAFAAEKDARGVAVAMRADIWDGTNVGGFNAIVQRLAERAQTFEEPVLLLEGDCTGSRSTTRSRRGAEARRDHRGAEPHPDRRRARRSASG
jgi:hypothetical protein